MFTGIEIIRELSEVFIEPIGVAVSNFGGIFRVYVTDWKEERIVELNEKGERKDIHDLSSFNFLVPKKLRDIDIEMNGDLDPLWVADARRVEIPKLTGGIIEIRNPVADKFVFMSGIAVDTLDNFYVTSNENSTFVKYTETGKLLNETSTTGTSMIDVATALNHTDLTDLAA